MRPIDKGNVPTNNSGNPKTVSDYADWRSDLIDSLGYYCVYCDMPLSHSLQVEHAVPKVPISGAPKGSLLDWDNMVLACGPCNNYKSNRPSDPSLHYLPESHNTLLAFQDVPHSTENDAWIVAPRGGLNPQQVQKAWATLGQHFLRLDNIDRRGAVVDMRWRKRKDAANAVASMRYVVDEAEKSESFNNNIGNSCRFNCKTNRFFQYLDGRIQR